MFEKDDYIIFTEAEMPNDYNFPINYIFKQRKSLPYLMPYLDCKGSSTNGWEGHRNFNNEYKNYSGISESKWRYATPKETTEYERLGKPYDVTTLQFTVYDYKYLIPILKKYNIK